MAILKQYSYVKVFQTILGSSIWAGPDNDLRVWIALLTLKDRNHVVHLEAPGISTLARVPLEDTRKALEKFQQPEADSMSKENDGRRIKVLPEGGYLILNGEKYARMLSLKERREYNARKMAEYRAQEEAEGMSGKTGGGARERQAVKAREEGREKDAEKLEQSSTVLAPPPAAPVPVVPRGAGILPHEPVRREEPGVKTAPGVIGRTPAGAIPMRGLPQMSAALGQGGSSGIPTGPGNRAPGRPEQTAISPINPSIERDAQTGLPIVPDA